MRYFSLSVLFFHSAHWSIPPPHAPHHHYPFPALFKVWTAMCWATKEMKIHGNTSLQYLRGMHDAPNTCTFHTSCFPSNHEIWFVGWILSSTTRPAWQITCIVEHQVTSWRSLCAIQVVPLATDSMEPYIDDHSRTSIYLKLYNTTQSKWIGKMWMHLVLQSLCSYPYITSFK